MATIRVTIAGCTPVNVHDIEWAGDVWKDRETGAQAASWRPLLADWLRRYIAAGGDDPDAEPWGSRVEESVAMATFEEEESNVEK